jgi:hypothetical protein
MTSQEGVSHKTLYLLAAVVLYACSSTEAGYWQGYVEGEYVYVAAPLADGSTNAM